MSFIPQEPVAVITASDIDRLWRAAGLDTLRRKHRSGDTVLYALLVKLHQVRLVRLQLAADGTPQRQEAASEEREYWTVQQLARASRRADRTVRKDIEDGELQATKTGRSWVIRNADARSYITSRERSR